MKVKFVHTDYTAHKLVMLYHISSSVVYKAHKLPELFEAGAGHRESCWLASEDIKWDLEWILREHAIEEDIEVVCDRLC